MNNPLEQFDRLYSSWSMADKAVKEMQLSAKWQIVKDAYLRLVYLYNTRGYLSPEEATTVTQLQQMLQLFSIQKMQVDKDLFNEMTQHLTKMLTKRW